MLRSVDADKGPKSQSCLICQVVEEEEPKDPHEALIEEIGRDEFGINVELSEDGQKLMNKQKERLGRSLDRLSRVLQFC